VSAVRGRNDHEFDRCIGKKLLHGPVRSDAGITLGSFVGGALHDCCEFETFD